MASEINKEDLNELDAIFKDMGGIEKVEDFTTNFKQLEDGVYIGEIEKVESKNSKNTGRPMIDIALALEGGTKEHKYLMLAGKDLEATQVAIARAVTQLKKLGLDGKEISDFIDHLENLIGLKVKLTVKTTNNFTNKDLTLI